MKNEKKYILYHLLLSWSALVLTFNSIFQFIFLISSKIDLFTPIFTLVLCFPFFLINLSDLSDDIHQDNQIHADKDAIITIKTIIYLLIALLLLIYSVFAANSLLYLLLLVIYVICFSSFYLNLPEYHIFDPYDPAPNGIVQDDIPTVKVIILNEKDDKKEINSDVKQVKSENLPQENIKIYTDLNDNLKQYFIDSLKNIQNDIDSERMYSRDTVTQKNLVSTTEKVGHLIRVIENKDEAKYDDFSDDNEL